jgi:alginate O-acetyltransferase complex protein AlgI
MIFTSLEFILFFSILLIVLKLIEKSSEAIKKLILLLSSYFFYGYWDWRFLILILLMTALNFVAGNKIAKSVGRQKKQWLIISLVTCIGILGFFKYFNFFVGSLKVILPTALLPDKNLNIILPLGISFFTFQAMSYAIDIYRGHIKPSTLLDFSIYIVFFPKLFSGPIARASHFLPQLKNRILLTRVNFKSGLGLFIIGFFKKSLLADSLSIFSDEVFNNVNMYDYKSLVAASIAYAFCIYLDFSGYSDMAIGIGRILGIELPANFNHPYKSFNVTEFWKRWHISLSSWFRDYLYIPLGGNRCSNIRTCFNLWVTMAICGLWHGASWNFVLWGVLHGFGLILNRLTKQITSYKALFKDEKQVLSRIVFIPVTFVFVCIGWVLFRANDLDTAMLFYSKIFKFEPGIFWIHISFYSIIPLMLLWQLIPDEVTERLKEKLTSFDTCLSWTSIVAMIMCILLFSPVSISPFIYFQF